MAIECFHCTQLPGTNIVDCPLPSTDPVLWSKNRVKYYDVDDPNIQVACAAGYIPATGRVYYQSGVPRDQCESAGFKQNIKIGLGRASGSGSEGVVTCCTEDGCNWNGTTAVLNLVREMVGGGLYELH